MIKIIGFDADDTLWVNEPYYRAIEKQFMEHLKEFVPETVLEPELFKTEIQNLELYGYGAKGFVLSMIETAIRISDKKVSNQTIEKIIELGKSLMDIKIDLLDDVELVLNKLKNKYKLIVATKGDLMDQERKLRKSGLAPMFHHIEIMSDKKEAEYSKLISNLGILPNEFLMIGNSVKSDILPVLNIGASGIHVPFHTTWDHEKVNDDMIDPGKFKSVEKLIDVLEFLL
jgi:putative hydrolase of the HAD superfamily